MSGPAETTGRKLPGGRMLGLFALFAAFFVVFGLLVSPLPEIARGLGAILFSRDTLITDYIGVGGMGAAFVNSGLLALLFCALYRLSGAPVTGASLACLFLALGFALFGKNLLNAWFIPAGVWLYSKFRREAFASHINVAIFGAALAPIFSEILFSTLLPVAASLPLSIATSLLIGFILVPVAGQLFHAHMGFSLYNMGFTAGIVGTVVVALYKSYGFVPEPILIWTTGHNLLLGSFLATVFGAMIAAGYAIDRTAPRRMIDLVSLSGQSPCDFTQLIGAGPTWLNMGLCGLIGMLYVLMVGGDLNGPTIGALFTIVGFAAFGKHPRNIVPIMAGVFLGTILKPLTATDPTIVLAALFGTTLAPIPGKFGWRWGLVAGFVHLSVAQTVGQLHGGLNLYNNGFAAGIVASVLAPIMIAVSSRGAVGQGKAREADPV
ncbi:DUF1576 domain-containing protein [uncultured Rhodoblastus sp.]|uniref:DUF1576 domain-containing protein n=1 Tax=uncultured Rhodoblastus sp. TaxID=543037 RepID=UPI0025E81B9E|nr:DUF1576 domain-containing protein [uncultured Rhodoblastus sp.]